MEVGVAGSFAERSPPPPPLPGLRAQSSPGAPLGLRAAPVGSGSAAREPRGGGGGGGGDARSRPEALFCRCSRRCGPPAPPAGAGEAARPGGGAPGAQPVRPTWVICARTAPST
ncbi:hypothetical protein VULLAG_LOCUS13091 [Vulpes lagopus]